MTKRTRSLELPYEVAESITAAYLKRQLVWMAEQQKQPPLFEEDARELAMDIEAVRRVVWWLTGESEYDDREG
jgi:hypothetical protein